MVTCGHHFLLWNYLDQLDLTPLLLGTVGSCGNPRLCLWEVLKSRWSRGEAKTLLPWCVPVCVWRAFSVVFSFHKSSPPQGSLRIWRRVRLVHLHWVSKAGLGDTVNADCLVIGGGIRIAWCLTSSCLWGSAEAPGATGTGWFSSSSLAGPACSVVASLPDALANMASGSAQNYSMKVEFILRCNQNCGLCMPAKCLAAGTTLPWAVAFFESPRKESTQGGWPGVI